MNITRWDPFREFEDVFRQAWPSRFMRGAEEEAGRPWKPLANISETDKEYLIKAELPEVKKEDIRITYENGMLTLSGERRYQKEDKNANELRVESFYGSFARSFALPDNISPEKIKAESKDGVLCVHIPKTESQQSKQITVQVH